MNTRQFLIAHLGSNDEPNRPSYNRVDDFLGGAGAGGNWPTINEYTAADVIAQEQPLFCGCACAQMMLGIYDVPNIPTQEDLFDLARLQPFTVEGLADAMNDSENPEDSRHWRGGSVEIEGAEGADLVEVLCQQGPWIAHLRLERERLGHWVIVERKINNEVHILDPEPPGTAYRMEIEAFLDYWTTQAVFLA